MIKSSSLWFILSGENYLDLKYLNISQFFFIDQKPSSSIIHILMIQSFHFDHMFFKINHKELDSITMHLFLIYLHTMIDRVGDLFLQNMIS